MRYLLAGVLVLAAGVGRTDAGPIQVGMPQDEVNKVLGRASASMSYGHFGSGAVVFYDRKDWLGGYEGWAVHIGPDKRVTYFKMDYHPFVETPPWLTSIRNALAPAGK